MTARGEVAHLYVHLPFCASRCGYCAFVVEVGGLGGREAYLRALLAELDEARPLLGSLATVYLGGGTPTLMGADALATLLGAVGPMCADGAEITVEANPETVTADGLRALVDAGLTRLSLGAQSFQPALLARLDRRATPADVRQAYAAAREAGVRSVSMDLLFAVPGQTARDLEADLAEVTALGPDHVSWYELELKPGSALARTPGLARDEDFSEWAYARLVEGLEASGYRWYELANWARDGHECRHSLAYWHARDYVGIGVGAVSTLQGRRWRNEPARARYEAALARGTAPPRTTESLDDDTRRRERWMLRLRLDEPMDMGWAGPPDHPDALRRLAELGLLVADGSTVALTRPGRFVQNAVVGELMDYA